MWELLAIALFAMAGVIALGFVMKRVVRFVGIPCQFCDNRKLTYFDQLSPQQKQAILSYFQQFEKRDPDTKGHAGDSSAYLVSLLVP